MRSRALVGVVSAFGLVFGGSPASAEILKNLRVGGQLDLQATSAYNVTDYVTSPRTAAPGTAFNDRIGDAQTRVMVWMDWDLLDDVHSRVTFRKNDRAWGTTGGQTINNPNAPQNSQTFGQAGGTDLLANIWMDEAWFKIDKLVGQFDLTLGRQFYGDPGDPVIYFGPSEKAWYGMPVTSIDAARVDWLPWEWLGVTGLAAKHTGYSVGTTAATATFDDIDIQGLHAKMNLAEWLGMQLYGYRRLTHRRQALGTPPTTANAGGLNDNLYIVGYRFRLSGGGFWFKGEYDQNFGNQRITETATTAGSAHYLGWFALGDVGWRGESDSAGMLSVWGQAALGSGRVRSRSNLNDGFQAINGDYRPGTIWGRFMPTSAFGGLGSAITTTPGFDSNNSPNPNPNMNNRQIWGGGVKMSPGFANKATLAVSWWDFSVHRWQHVPGQNTHPYLGKNHIGAELDVDLQWAHSENVGFSLGWANFRPGGLIVKSVTPEGQSAVGRGVNPVQVAYFDTRIRF